MTYRDYQITADVDTAEQWDVDDEGNLTEWLEDYDRMENIVYVVRDSGDNIFDTYGSLEDAKEAVDGIVEFEDAIS